METDEHPFIIDYLSSGAEILKGFWSNSINAGERGFNAREIEPSRDAVLAMVQYDMVFYLPTSALQGGEQHSFNPLVTSLTNRYPPGYRSECDVELVLFFRLPPNLDSGLTS